MADALDDILDQAEEDAVTIDLSGAVEFADCSIGWHEAVITKCKPGVSKEGNPKLEWYTTVDDESDESNGAFGPISHTVTSGKNKDGSPANTGNAKKWLRAIGVDVDDPTVSFKPADAVDKRVRIRVVEKKGFLEIANVEASQLSDVDPLDEV